MNSDWKNKRLKQILGWEKYHNHKNFIDHADILSTLATNKAPQKEAVREIIQKARSNAKTGEMLSPAEQFAMGISHKGLGKYVEELLTSKSIERVNSGDKTFFTKFQE